MEREYPLRIDINTYRYSGIKYTVKFSTPTRCKVGIAQDLQEIMLSAGRWCIMFFHDENLEVSGLFGYLTSAKPYPDQLIFEREMIGEACQCVVVPVDIYRKTVDEFTSKQKLVTEGNLNQAILNYTNDQDRSWFSKSEWYKSPENCKFVTKYALYTSNWLNNTINAVIVANKSAIKNIFNVKNFSLYDS